MHSLEDDLLGLRLVAAGLITPEQLQLARMQAARTIPPSRLADVLIEQRQVTEQQLRSLPRTPPHDTIPLVAEPAGVGGSANPGGADATAGARQKVGRYEVHGELGRGAMGVVYRAWDVELRRPVALKVLHTAFVTTGDARQRFDREARLAARVVHDGLARIYDVGEANGCPFYAMELVEGESLASCLQRLHRLPARTALRIARDVARGLQAVHDHGLVHRDIKPGNVLLAPLDEGTKSPRDDEEAIPIGGRFHTRYRVLLSDFGLAKELTNSATLTREGAIVGTPQYLSPEQALGNQPVTPHSDIYGVGVLLYEMLSGKPPFVHEDLIALIARIRTDDPPPLCEAAPGLHHDLETIVATAMDRSPGRRYASAAKLAEDLDRMLAGEAILARPTGVFRRCARLASRHRTITGSTAAALVVSLLALIAPTLAVWRIQRREAEARDFRARDAAQRFRDAEALWRQGDASAAEREARGLVAEYGAVIRVGEDLHLQQAHDLLARILEAGGDPRQALAEWFHAQRAALGTAAGEGYLLASARGLVLDRRPDQAIVLLTRLRQRARSTRAHAQVASWMGQALAARLEFAVAIPELTAALAGGDLPEELRASTSATLALCRSLADRRPLATAPGFELQSDLDRDGSIDLLRIEGDGIVVHLASSEKAVRCNPEVTDGIENLRCFPLAGKHADGPALAVGWGKADRSGAIELLRVIDGRLERLIKVDLPSHPTAAVLSDLDGDGTAELAICTAGPDAALRIFSLSADAHRSSLRAMRKIGAECETLLGFDFEADRKPELALVYGPWNGYGALVFRWSPADDRIDLVARTTLGIPESWVELGSPAGPPAWAVGVSWHATMMAPLRRLLGDRVFQDRYRPVGCYLLTPKSPAGFDVQPLVTRGWQGPASDRCRLLRTRYEGRQWLWALFESPDGRGTSEAHVFEVSGAPLPVAVLIPPPGFQIERSVAGADNGASELVVLTDAGRVAFGPHIAAPPVPPRSISVPETDREPPATSGAVLEVAGDAELAGLDEEALQLYRETATVTRSPAEAATATAGMIRCLARMGRYDELLPGVAAVAEGFPSLRAPLLHSATELLEHYHAWPQALAAARELTRHPAPSRSDAAAALSLEARVRGLAEPDTGVPLLGAGAARIDWLATSPYVARWQPDGSVIVWLGTEEYERIEAVVQFPQHAWRLEANVSVERIDWAAGCTLGTGVGDQNTWESAWRSAGKGISLLARGDSQYPLYLVSADTTEQTLADALRLADRRTLWQGPIALRSEWVAHLGHTRTELEAEGKRVYLDVPAPATSARVGLAGFRSARAWTPGQWCVLHVNGLRLLGDGAGPAHREAPARTAHDLLLTAHGLRVAGRNAEALSKYDLAVALGDRQRAYADDTRAAGLPSPWSGEPDDHLETRAAVDARWYRGLLHAALSRSDQARADLDAALALSPSRVRRLIARDALPLRACAPEARIVREFWRDRLAPASTGYPANEEQLQAVAEEFGEEGALLLCAEARRVTLRAPVPFLMLDTDPAALAGLRPGDRILAVDGRPVTDAEGFRRALTAATTARQSQVTVKALRQSSLVEFSFPADTPLPLLVDTERTELRRE